MKALFKEGDSKVYKKVVQQADVASFEVDGMVHPVCATFALARDIEWASRLFVLDMKEEDEEGIGTMLTIHHKSPAGIGDSLTIEAKVKSCRDHELICTYTVYAGHRLIAEGETGQKILKKEKIERLLSSLK